MKKQVLLVLLFLVGLSFQLSAETLYCQHSFELGKMVAKEDYKVWGWYLLGIGGGIGEMLVGLPALYLHGTGGAIAAVLVTHVILFPPALMFPQPTRIRPPSIEVELDCYRDGYKRKATGMNFGALMLGELTGLILGFALLVVVVGVN